MRSTNEHFQSYDDVFHCFSISLRHCIRNLRHSDIQKAQSLVNAAHCFFDIALVYVYRRVGGFSINQLVDHLSPYYIYLRGDYLADLQTDSGMNPIAAAISMI
ncbi:hypothetical protein [Bacillus atrophaeus]|uniref:hypothetical protein n=1 Tax=Bacillus atrophaeus TaxID=1452 RepID=UPI00147816A6|nr:hypothetical protein [Bacillus atrophaeus]MCY8827889.1 hypothetical protein [Bacillus atrophaeus]MCY8831942.1 hypothetical protein [Bacillus atrophaeus]MEC0801602.1 hypothetical protein [Bacillus atrophaeus]MEC0811570.1 hypothetical protein [Bacillus atrophaeus]MEC0815504.1 hypothetical protein [Bacillus atrophaeus]